MDGDERDLPPLQLPRFPNLSRSLHPDIAREMEDAIAFFEGLFTRINLENIQLKQRLSNIEKELKEAKDIMSSLKPSSASFPFLQAAKVSQPRQTPATSQPPTSQVNPSQGLTQQQVETRKNATNAGLAGILERSTRTVGVYPVDTDTILAIHQQKKGDMALYSKDEIKKDARFDDAKYDAGYEFLTEELNLEGLKIKAVHINADFDAKMMYLEMEHVKDTKTVFGRVASLAKRKQLGNNKVINYFPGIVYRRKQAILAKLKPKRDADNEHKYQIRMGLTDIEIHKKKNGPENKFYRIPLSEVIDDVDSLPPIGWDQRDFDAPRGRRVRQVDVARDDDVELSGQPEQANGAGPTNDSEATATNTTQLGQSGASFTDANLQAGRTVSAGQDLTPDPTATPKASAEARRLEEAKRQASSPGERVDDDEGDEEHQVSHNKSRRNAKLARKEEVEPLLSPPPLPPVSPP